MLAASDLVVSHGGSGNAMRARELGVATTLAAATATLPSVESAVAVLERAANGSRVRP